MPAILSSVVCAVDPAREVPMLAPFTADIVKQFDR